MYRSIKHLLAVTLGITGLVALQACKKTETVGFEQKASNLILEYKVDNASEPLYGVVDNIDNTITVSLPYYLSIDYIVPKIKLSDGAKLVDKNNNIIDLKEDLEPVRFDSVGYVYRIKDAKDVLRTYTLVNKIYPYQTKLQVGYVASNRNGVITYDTLTPKDVVINSTFTIVGNFQSSSRNGKITITDKKTNKVIPNAVQITNVQANALGHVMTIKTVGTLDSGSYAFTIEHQGRKANVPTLHLIHKKPVFTLLGKEQTVGSTMTLTVQPNQGVNTGIKNLYIMVRNSWPTFTQFPAAFDATLFNKPIPVEIVSQNRTQLQFKFPEMAIGRYVNYIEISSTLLQSSFGLYADFNSAEWGSGFLISGVVGDNEVLPKK